jgi:hypothetical protein
MLAAAEEVRASGGPHVVDDAEVEIPGLCHAESWLTGFGDGRRLVNLSPACTFHALSSVEFGAAIQHGWEHGHRHTLIGPAVKVALRSPSRGIGLGVALSAAVDAESGKAESAAVLVPVTIDLTPRVRTNFNLSYQWARTGDRHGLVAGAQVEARVHGTLSLMAEGFVRDGGKPGFQAGLRWTPRAWIDVDLLGGRRVDGTGARAITLGVTLRR